MRGVFDDRVVEQAEPQRDTELTLSSAMLLAIFFGLVLICGLCFAWGYAVGRHGSHEPSEAAQPGAGGRETVQGNGSRPKPSAMAPGGVAATQQSAAADQVDDGALSAGSGGNADGSAQGSGANADGSAQGSAATGAAGSSNGQPQLRPALGPAANLAQPVLPAASRVGPALAPAGSLMVQIAAVSHPEDADVLMTALRKRGYAVTAHREATDGLIHVRIGPFNSGAEAEKWRQKLLNDGYNAIVLP